MLEVRRCDLYPASLQEDAGFWQNVKIAGDDGMAKRSVVQNEGDAIEICF